MDFEGSGLVIDSVSIKASSQTFQTGQIQWTVCGDNDLCVQLNGGMCGDKLKKKGGGESCCAY